MKNPNVKLFIFSLIIFAFHYSDGFSQQTDLLPSNEDSISKKCVPLITGDKDKKVFGYVLESETSKSIKFANIIIVGANAGTMTNENGEFLIQLPEKYKKLAISHGDYESKTIEPKGDTVKVFLNRKL